MSQSMDLVSLSEEYVSAEQAWRDARARFEEARAAVLHASERMERAQRQFSALLNHPR